METTQSLTLGIIFTAFFIGSTGAISPVSRVLITSIMFRFAAAKVGLVLLEKFNRLPAITCFGDGDHVRLAVYDGRQSYAYDKMILDDHQGNFIF